jgi:phenylalanyl-tRNA synthetase alpha chain
MQDKIDEIILQLKIDKEEVKDLEALKHLRAEYVSKSIFLSDLRETIKNASPEDKASIGKLLGSYTGPVNEILNDKKEELANKFDLEEVDNPFLGNGEVKLNKEKGFLHPLTLLTKEIENFFDSLGYEYEHGIEVESEEINFNALNMPDNHPARTMQDTFYLEEEGMLLRTHSTNITARHLATLEGDSLKSYSIGTVFRNDENDATHSYQFNQIDIFNVGKNISIANMK